MCSNIEKKLFPSADFRRSVESQCRYEQTRGEVKRILFLLELQAGVYLAAVDDEE